MGIPLFTSTPSRTGRSPATPPRSAFFRRGGARRSLAPERGARAEPLRDGLPPSRLRRMGPSLVHSHRRGRSLRTRDARLRARSLAGRIRRRGSTLDFHTRSGTPVGLAGAGRNRSSSTFPRSPRRLRPSAARRSGCAERLVPVNLREEPDGLLRRARRRSSTSGCLRPDFRGVAEACGPARGVIVTARSRAGRSTTSSRAISRPPSGIDEDPVTGSAHCCLGPFWAERLGKTELAGFQASAEGRRRRGPRPRGRVRPARPRRDGGARRAAVDRRSIH